MLSNWAIGGEEFNEIQLKISTWILILSRLYFPWECWILDFTILFFLIFNLTFFLRPTELFPRFSRAMLWKQNRKA